MWFPVSGQGDVRYLGGGLLGRGDFKDTGPGHVYTEASVRTGGLRNEYRNDDLRDGMGRRAEYDSDSPYYGFHLGTGYIWRLTDSSSLDLYGKYFWTRMQGDSVTLSTGDPVKFEDTDSSRLRLGGRFTATGHEFANPYVGAAYEHEFDGEARASTRSYKINSPKLTGGTGIAEVGLLLKPSRTLPLSLDFGMQLHVGTREGVSGSLQIKYEF